MDLVSFCLIPVNEVSIRGPKTLKASKFDQNDHFESFKAIALSYIKSLEFIKQIHQEMQEIISALHLLKWSSTVSYYL